MAGAAAEMHALFWFRSENWISLASRSTAGLVEKCRGCSTALRIL